MNLFSILLGVFVVALLAFYFLMRSGKFTKKPVPESPDYPYIRESALLNAYEQSLYDVLIRALGERYGVFAKVGLSAILSIDPELPDRDLGSSLERIERAHVDFVLCEKNSTEILGIIQLDPYTHQPDGRRRHDTFIELSLKAAGVPIVQMPIKDTYSESELRVEITRSLVLDWGQDTASEGQTGTGEASRSVAQLAGGQPLGECPDCGSPLMVRQAHKGKFAGKHLLACSRYPACKNIRLIKQHAAILEALS